ncbi:N-acetylglutaminylglutamine synthetase [soil metagenome]
MPDPDDGHGADAGDRPADAGDRGADGGGRDPTGRGSRSRKRYDHRLNRGDRLSTGHHDRPDGLGGDGMGNEVVLDLGWGRLLFGQTYASHAAVHEALMSEVSGKRDIAIYPVDPHVLVGTAPADLFIDPSLTSRLWLHRYRPRKESIRGIKVRFMETERDAAAINRIYAACDMVTADEQVMIDNQHRPECIYLIAEDTDTGAIIGTVTGVDHAAAFGDPEWGSSLWCLATDPQSSRPGTGEALIRHLTERFVVRGRAYMDLSVMHDNEGAILLYDKLGFERVPVFAVKRKNPINEKLYTAPGEEADLNPYARIVVDEAHRRGVAVDIVDADAGLLQLSYGGRSVSTRESLSDLTSAVAMTRCDDKALTRRLLAGAGIAVPEGQLVEHGDADTAFLLAQGQIVVKPARGEQGKGITVGVTDPEQLGRAIEEARQVCPDVLLEELVEGDDLRVLVIDYRVVAAAVRRPPEVVGDGRHTAAELIDAQSRRRERATGGESAIPMDDQTVDTLGAQGVAPDEVVEEGQVLQVRRTANLHTGGTIHDVTDRLHPALAEAAVTAAEVLEIPVVGMDLLVKAVDQPDYVIIEANERPGLANHEPQPTAQAFLDLLFPRTRRNSEGTN